MTAILAIDYLYQIIVVSDCRVTWLGHPPKLQDNLQKVYPIGPTGVLGFAGGVSAAKAVVSRLVTKVKGKLLPPSATHIVDDIASSAQEAYSSLRRRDKLDLELMYVAADYGNLTLRAENVTFAKNILIKMKAPEFKPVEQSDYVALGYAINYPGDLIRQNRDNMLNYGLDPVGRKFQIGISIGAYGEGLAKLAGDPVGGLFSVGVVNASGVRWSSYSYGDQVEMKIEDGKFVQYDLVDGRRVPLKTLVEFDPRNPDAGNNVFNTPTSSP